MLATGGQRQALQLRRCGRPRGFSKGVKRVEFGFVPLLNVLPTDFHRRREAVVLYRENLVREVQPLRELVPTKPQRQTRSYKGRMEGEEEHTLSIHI